MTTDEALDFLRQHQPLPDDDRLSEPLIRRYDEVRKHFLEHPDPRCIPLFLNSFGSGGGWGVYVLIEGVIGNFTPEEVLPHLTLALKSPLGGVKYWSTQIACDFPSVDLIEPLKENLTQGDIDVRFAAALSLGEIEDEWVVPILREALICETEEDLCLYIQDILQDIQNKNNLEK